MVNIDKLIEELESIENCDTEYKKAYLYSLLLKISKDKVYAEKLIDLMLENDSFGLETKYYIYNQIKTRIFLGEFDIDIYFKAKLQKYFDSIIDGYKKSLSKKLQYISKESRNKKFVIMITDQFIGEGHGPTKSAMGRCRALQKMGMEVLLINTAEMLSAVGSIPIYGDYIGSYNPEYLKYEAIQWRDVQVAYFQCDNNMPNLEVVEYLLDVIERLKPYFIVNIGGDSIVASLAGNIVPTLAVSMQLSEIRVSGGTCYTFGKKLTEIDKKYLELIDKREEWIIEHRFTSDLVEQQSHTTKSMLGIGENKFVIAVVGGRLVEEITKEFVDMMAKVVDRDSDIIFMIMGDCKEDVFELYPGVKNNIKCMGFVSDILGYMESCDLYVNPIRKGGGMSCVEAMIKGVPAITTDYGDVAVNAGVDFFTEDYDTMIDLIIRYKNDANFYRVQSEKAIERAQVCLDTDGCFKEVVEKFLERVE